MRKINLLNLPTPLHEIDVDNKNNYFIKRDDLTGFALGGNKTRKIEYFLYDVLKKGCNYLVTYGSAQSNHCRVVAFAAARLGMGCLLILAGSGKQFGYTGNDIFYTLNEAHIKWCSVNEVSVVIKEEMKRLKGEGYKPYFIEGGGHGNCGTAAYLEVYKEIRHQAYDSGVNFDYIFLASGTGTTQAGLIVGKRMLKGNEKIVGISIARTSLRGREIIKKSVNAYLENQEEINLIEENDIIFNDFYVGKGYGDVNEEIVKVIQNIYCRNSIILDPIYTGKAFWGMCDYIKKNNIEGKDILFIHTGGFPLFFNEGKRLVNLLK